MINQKNQMKNKQGGFLQLIILIILALFIMSYFHISVSDIVNWFKVTLGLH